MKISVIPFSLILLLMTAGPGISMSGQTIDGNPKDPKVIACGLHIEGGKYHTVRPFIETSETIDGHLELTVQAISGSNKNMTVQRSSLSNMPVVTVGGDVLNIRLLMRSGQTVLCEMNEKIEFGPIDI